MNNHIKDFSEHLRVKNIGKCIVKECGNSQRAKHLCSKHYDKLRKYGDPSMTKYLKNSGKCKIEGCSNMQFAKHLCEKHYCRYRRHGNPHIVKKRGSPRGGRSPNWKGGKTIYGGRVYIYAPLHPCSRKSGYIARSRLVMEGHLGRYLKPEEIVHHENEITNDDKFGNLQLFKNRAEHLKYHCKKRRQ